MVHAVGPCAHPSSAHRASIKYQKITRVKQLTAAVHSTVNAIKEAGAIIGFIGGGLNMMK